ncbi:MAG: histidine kinase [Chloroflexia bacterium]|nr:histidine kinase [Chloroflexia bacterium]
MPKLKFVEVKKNYRGLRTFLRDLLIILLAGLLITYFFILDFDKLVESIVPTLLYSALIGITLWKGNEWISIQIHNKADWKKRPERKFGVGVLVMIVYSILAIIFVSFVWFVFWEGGSVTNFEMPSFRLFAILLGVTLIIGFGLNIREFIIEKQDILLREEKLKTEVIKLEYEALKNQVNPHFLFNSLNALTSLVTDNEEAVKFIKMLSEVYRYVLEQKDKEVVPLYKEMNFVTAYAYLHKIRFGENFQMEIEIQEGSKNVVPLSIQMLVENAIKHNVVSDEEPLKITIYQKDDYVIVENNLQPKSMVKDSNIDWLFFIEILLIIQSILHNFF